MQAYYESLSLDPKVEEQLTEANAGETLLSLMEEALPKVPEEVQTIVNMDILMEFSETIAPLTVQYAPTLLQHITREIGRGFYQGLDQSAGVLSLTKKRDNLLMWAHYGQQHMGMVIGFDSEHPFFNQKLHSGDDFRHLRRVKYSQDRPMIRLSEEEDFARILLTKSPEWAYEDEWRMILPLEASDAVHEHRGNKVYLFQFPHNCVKEIIFGVRMDMEVRKEILEYIHTSQKYRSAKILEAKLDSEEFKLNFLPLKGKGDYWRNGK